MLGAIIGDIVGSRFEFHNHTSKQFDFFHECCYFTDDSVMTLAIAEALLLHKRTGADLATLTVKCMQELGRAYPNCGYGGRFEGWLHSDDPKPYQSYGNGAAMRVSPVAYMSDDEETVKRLSFAVTAVTHDHEEGIKGAEATSMAILMARKGKSKAEIREYIEKNYYSLTETVKEIREHYYFNETCQGTVPQAIICFLESTSFEDAIRNAVSIGGDSDTLAAITGSIAEAFYGLTEKTVETALFYLTDELGEIALEWLSAFPPKKSE